MRRLVRPENTALPDDLTETLDFNVLYWTEDLSLNDCNMIRAKCHIR